MQHKHWLALRASGRFWLPAALLVSVGTHPARLGATGSLPGLLRERRASGMWRGLSEYNQQTNYDEISWNLERSVFVTETRFKQLGLSSLQQCCVIQMLSWNQSSPARFPHWIFTENKTDYKLRVTCQTYLVNIITALKRTLRVWVRHKPKDTVKCVGWRLLLYCTQVGMYAYDWWVHQVAHAVALEGAELNFNSTEGGWNCSIAGFTPICSFQSTILENQLC